MIGAIGSAVPSIPTRMDVGLDKAASSQTAGSNFANLLQSAVKEVDGMQNSADQQVASLLQGNANADIGKTMVSVEKADVAFQLLMQVRNKAVSAYQEMEKMQF